MSFHQHQADGRRWALQAGDDRAYAILSNLAEIMGLQASNGRCGIELSLTVSENGTLQKSFQACLVAVRCGMPARCILEPPENRDHLIVLLQKICIVFAADAQLRGGALVHGALAELNGQGVILAAPGGTGKSTASARLPSPWRSLCDDATLVVRDDRGRYFAHPWPTWSRFFFGGQGGSWRVEEALPLKAVFFLEQWPEDEANLLSQSETSVRLVSSIEQASRLMTHHIDDTLACKIRLEWLENACALARAVPGYRLRISLVGRFWEEMEEAMKGDSIC